MKTHTTRSSISGRFIAKRQHVSSFVEEQNRNVRQSRIADRIDAASNALLWMGLGALLPLAISMLISAL